MTESFFKKTVEKKNFFSNYDLHQRARWWRDLQHVYAPRDMCLVREYEKFDRFFFLQKLFFYAF